MTSLKKELNKLGWHLSDEGIDVCKEEINSNKRQILPQDIINNALNIDLSEIGESFLSDELSKGKVKEFRGPSVLQITKIRNVSAPKANENSSIAPRLLKLHFTDGHKTCVGIEQESFEKSFSLNTPPGTKVRLNGTIKLQNGFLLLTAQNITCLGGVVENLFNKWKSTKDASGFSRDIASGEDAPPPFVPFGKNITYQCNTSNPALQSATKTNDDQDDEFSEQRESAIAKVRMNMSDAQGKTFSGARNKPNATAQSGGYVHRNDRQDYKRHQDSGSDYHRKTSDFKVDENLCLQITQMGFSRSDAVSVLRNHNNDIERALDELIHPTSYKSHSNQHPRGERSGSTRGRGRGGRRSNNRGDRPNKMESDTQHQPTTTLFDYVESTITKSKSKNNSKPKNNPPPPRTEAPAPGPMDDDALQEEYIMQYVKELSMVETHGGSQASRLDQFELQTEASSSQVTQISSENSGVSKYRSAGNSRTSTSNRRENRDDSKEFNSNRYQSDRTVSNRYQSDNRHQQRNSQQKHDGSTAQERPRREQFNSKTFIRSDTQNRHESNSRFARDDRNDQSNYQNDKRREHQTRTNDNYDKRTKFKDKGRYDNTKDYSTDDSDGHRSGYRQQGGARRNDSYNSDRRKGPGNLDRPNKFVPPRLQRKQQQQQHENFESNSTRSDQFNDSFPKKKMTLADTNRQLKHEDSSHSSSPRYNVHEGNDSRGYQQRSPASHSYQDQRQQQQQQIRTDRNPMFSEEQSFSNSRPDRPIREDKNPKFSENQFYHNQPQQQQQQQQPIKNPMFPYQHSEFHPRHDYHNNDELDVIEWKPGMCCQAMYWEDGQYYKAVVMDVHQTEPTAVVVFINYGNSEEVYFKNMRPDKSGPEHSFGDDGSLSLKRNPIRPSQTLYQPPIRK